MGSLVYLSLGSNLGERESHLREAIERLEKAGRVISVSAFYETEPVEVTDQPWFLNCAVAMETSETPAELMASLRSIEQKMGRDRVRKKGPRNIDIDILLFGDKVAATPELTIPHPEMANRRFVLEPMAEIAPGAWHPGLNRSVRELLNDLPGDQRVHRMANDHRPTTDPKAR